MTYAVASDGARIHYDVRGAGDPLVLLAGQANSHHWWDGVRADFEGAFRTIDVDHLGTGASDAPRGAEYSTRRFAADVVAVLDALGVERAHVYGTSMGGKVAQWLAADHPERVAALVLGCTTPGGPHGLVAPPEVLAPLAGPPAQATAALVDLMFTPDWVRARSGPFTVLGDDTMTPPARRGHRRASAGHDAWDALPRITAPTLVVHGTADLFCPTGNAPLLAGRIRGAELWTVDGARHAYFEEFRAEASPAVLRFLAGHRLGSAIPGGVPTGRAGTGRPGPTGP
jgi:3-oxoadipate enol-lactonase